MLPALTFSNSYPWSVTRMWMALLYISTALKWLLRKKTASSLGLRSCSRTAA